MLLLPNELLQPKNSHRTIGLDGCTVVESCFYEDRLNDRAFLAEHEIIYILSGKIVIEADGQKVELTKGESVLIKKGQSFEFTKLGAPNIGHYESLLFFLQPRFIQEFIQWYNYENLKEVSIERPMLKLEKSAILDGFMVSLMPYFDEIKESDEEILRLKTFELLLHLTKRSKNAFQFLFQLQEKRKLDLVKTMEAFYLKNLPLEEFASLSGRSLASFKRDFGQIFNETPGKWLKKRRLEYADKLMRKTKKKPSSVYLEAGFEDYGHFSRSYKAHFGFSPSEST